jgi:hypothetical protein
MAFLCSTEFGLIRGNVQQLIKKRVGTSRPHGKRVIHNIFSPLPSTYTAARLMVAWTSVHRRRTPSSDQSSNRGLRPLTHSRSRSIDLEAPIKTRSACQQAGNQHDSLDERRQAVFVASSVTLGVRVRRGKTYLHTSMPCALTQRRRTELDLGERGQALPWTGAYITRSR